MTAEQCAFDFTAPPPAEVGEVERLLNHLSNNPGFHTRKELSAALGLSDRAIREIAEQNPELIVSGPGSPGYCHIYHCPDEQTGHIIEMLMSQGKKMIKRAIRTRRAARLLAIKRIR